MKKIRFLLMVACFLVFGASNSMALQFSLDLDGTLDSSDYGTYTDIFRIQVDGYAEVDQSFGADGIFNSGDTFTEMTLLQQITYTHSFNGTNQNFEGVDDADKVLYLYANGLTGKAINVSGAPGSETFDYLFDAGSGSIGLYLGDDNGALGYTAGDLLVASFSLVKGDGAAKDGFLGGLENAGTTRLTGEFLPETPNLVWEALGLDLGNLPAGYTAFAYLNTTNQVIDPTTGEGTTPDLYGARYLTDDNGNPILDDDDNPIIIGYDGFTATINSTGHMSVDVVPEPATLMLFGIGLLGLAGISRRKKA